MNIFDERKFNKIQESIKLHESAIKLDKLIHAGGFNHAFSKADIQDLKKTREEITDLIEGEIAKKVRFGKLRTLAEERDSLAKEESKATKNQKEIKIKLNEKIKQVEILQKGL